MKLDIVKVCAGLIIVLTLLMCSSVATETTWRHSGFELWGYDINFTDHNASNIYLLDADYLHGDCSNVTNLNASNISSGEIPLTQIPATLTGKDADTVDGYHAADLGGNTGGFAAEGSEIFNASVTLGNVWQDLDLSAAVGSRYAIVMLSASLAAGADTNSMRITVKQKGSTRTYISTGTSAIENLDGGDAAYMVVVTNSSGVIELKGSSNNALDVITINIVGWVGLS